MHRKRSATVFYSPNNAGLNEHSQGSGSPITILWMIIEG